MTEKYEVDDHSIEMTQELKELKNNNSNPLINLEKHSLLPKKENPIILKNDKNGSYLLNKLVITPDGKKALAYDSKLVFWDLENGKSFKLGEENYSCYVVDITQDGKLALTSDRKTLTLWNLDEKNPVQIVNSPNCMNIIIKPNRQIAAVIFYDNVKFYDLSNWKVVKEISGYDGLYTFSISADFKIGVWVSDANLVVFDLETDKIIKIIPGRSLMNVENTIINSDVSKVLDFRYHKMNFLWDIENGEFIGKIGDCITDVTPDFKLAITGWDIPGKLLDITKLVRVGTLLYKSKRMKNLNGGSNYFYKDSKITPNGKKCVSLDKNSNICIWNLEKGNQFLEEDLEDIGQFD